MAPRKIRPVATLLGHSSWSLRCAISADGRFALSGDGVPSARVWDIEEPSNSREFASDLPLGIRQCALSEDGSIAAVAADGRGVSINELSSGQRLFIIEEPTEERAQYSAGGCALTGDGDVLIAAFRTSNRARGQLHIVRWKNPAAKPIILKRDYSIWQCEISSDARKVVFKYWKGSKSGVELVDIPSGETIGKWEVSNGEWNFAIDATARILVTADSRNLRVIDMKTGDSRNMKSYTFSAFAGVDISANGKHVVAPMADYKFGIWEAETGRLIALLGGHQNRSNGCAISADGTRVLTCSNDHTVRVWDTRGATSGIGADAVREALRSMMNAENRSTSDHLIVRESVHECELGNAEELLQAHAALVIALRSAAANHDSNQRNLIQKSAEMVYATIEGKLHDKPDVQLGQVVMAHAEQRGLLSSGLPVQHMGTYYNLSEKSIGRLRENINSAWKEVIPLKDKENIDNVILKHLDRLYTSMKVGKEGIENGLFSDIASCVLLVWSGSKSRKLGNEYGKPQSRSIKSMLAIESPKDVAWIETIMPFDISSPRVLRYLMKRINVEKLPPRRKHLIQKAVSNSKFQSLEKVESELTALIEKLARAKGKFQSVMEIDIEDIPEVADSDDESASKKRGHASVRSTTIKSPLILSRSKKFESPLEDEHPVIVKDTQQMEDLLHALQENPKAGKEPYILNNSESNEVLESTKKTRDDEERKFQESPEKNNNSLVTKTEESKAQSITENINNGAKNELPTPELEPKPRKLQPNSHAPSPQILSSKPVMEPRLPNAEPLITARSIGLTENGNAKESNTVNPIPNVSSPSSETANAQIIENTTENREKSKNTETIVPVTGAPVLMQAMARTKSEIAPDPTRQGSSKVLIPQTPELTQLDRSTTIKTYVPEKDIPISVEDEEAVKSVIERLSITEENRQMISGNLDEIRLSIEDDDDEQLKVLSKKGKKGGRTSNRSRTNVLLGIAALVAFIICTALLALVILRMR